LELFFGHIALILGEITFPLLVGLGTTFGFSVLIALTTRWHGFLSLDEPAGVQKVHAHPTARIGGLPIVLGLFSAVLVLPSDVRQEIWPWLISGCPAFIFGLIEDLTKRVGVLARLLATMASGILAWILTGNTLTGVGVVGLDWFFQWTTVAVVFTSFAVGGVANAINIIDGLNGLASSMVLWALLGIAILAANFGDTVLASACLLLAVCVLGFFMVNWPLGKLFLGDGGSYFLGFALAWFSILLVERHPEVSAFAVLMLCAHPITEVLYSVYRRKIRNKHLGHPDRLHLHSLFMRRMIKWSMFNGNKTFCNSFSGLMIGGVSLLTAILVQFTYKSTLANLAVIIVLVLIYLRSFKTMTSGLGAERK
jgi:UDP-N-acetylmuramyl pentapeptide phosphotransferase/UDP-N-acetylglucosamine-1-phosphate transferase